MDGGAIAGFTSIGVLVVGNIVVVAYSYGRVTQQVKDLCRRVGRLEDTLNNKVEKEQS